MEKLTFIHHLPQIIHKGREIVKTILEGKPPNIKMAKYMVIPKNKKSGVECEKIGINSFYQGDNLIIMEKLLKSGYRERFDLIYIDPPFLSNANYKSKVVVGNKGKEDVIECLAYKDIWAGGLLNYLENLCISLSLMKKLLSPQGTIYVHLDFRTVHYVKVLMDEIFGRENFLNEVIWAYKSGGASSRYYARKHDNILVYTKTKDYIFNSQFEKSYNRGLKPYRFKGVEEFKDELGWYTLVRLRDVWNIDMVGRTSRERVGYSTQKPEKLLERVILTSSKEGSLVGDFFAGSGTLGVVAARHNRQWIMVDKGKLSKVTTNNRLIQNTENPYKICILGDSREKIGKLFIKNIDTRKASGQEIINIEISRYELNIEKIHINKKYKKLVKGILKTNSLALIDFIGIDPNYKGGTPRLSYQIYRKKGNLIINNKISIVKPNGKEGEKIYLKVIDVFGNELDYILAI